MLKLKNNFKMLSWHKKQLDKNKKKYLVICSPRQELIPKRLRNNKLLLRIKAKQMAKYLLKIKHKKKNNEDDFV